MQYQEKIQQCLDFVENLTTKTKEPILIAVVEYHSIKSWGLGKRKIKEIITLLEAVGKIEVDQKALTIRALNNKK